MHENEKLDAQEQVVLMKYEGDPKPENAFERLVIENGQVVSHEKLSNGEVVGPVEESEILGRFVGTLTPIETEKEVD